MPTAKMSPSDFVDRLTDPGLIVAGYPTPVSLRRYLCANKDDGGNAKAAVFRDNLPELIKGTSDAAILSPLITSWEYGRLFSGQGKPEPFETVMAIVWRNKDKVKADSRFAKYFASTVISPLQEMVDDGLFGMDCIGFFGRYLEAAGLYSAYPGGYPRDWLNTFLPVRTPYDMDVCSALIWIQGQHIAIIDSFEESNWNANPPHAIINICQCSDGVAHGPQTSQKVKLLRRNQATMALDIAKYNEAIKIRDPNDPKKFSEVSESEKVKLRASLKSSVVTGYLGGIFFDIVQGDPTPPVPGPVYVGTMRNLTLSWLIA
jgi:hypothetical protein